jgi:signal transduction histidine kinase
LKNTGEPEVNFNAWINNNHLEIRIYDNGIGVDQQIRKSMFDMFFKGNEQSKGNGLGLYIVHKSLQALGGTIEIETEPEVYTRFVIRIPLQEKTDTRHAKPGAETFLTDLVMNETRKALGNNEKKVEALN